MAIEYSVNKDMKKVYFKSYCSGNGRVYEGRSYVRLNGTCHKCVNKGCLQKDCSPKGTDFSGNPPKKSKFELPEWVTYNPIVSCTKDIATSTITHNNNN